MNKYMSIFTAHHTKYSITSYGEIYPRGQQGRLLIYMAERIDNFLLLTQKGEYLQLMEEVRKLMTPLFTALENAHGPRRTSKKIERQRYNLKAFTCPILTVCKFLQANI